MSKLSCSLSKQSDITVGEKLDLACSGALGGLQMESLQIKDAQLSDEIPALSLLEVKSSTSEKLELIVTGYRTGEHSLSEVVLYDGNSKVELEGAQWTVNSVLSKDPTQPPQPTPRFEMTDLSYPLWFWGALLAVLILLIIAPYRNYKRLQKDKMAFDDLKNLEAAQSPIDSFYRNLRKLEKSLNTGSTSPKDFVIQLNKEFRIYLSRAMHFPAHIFEIPRIIKYIKSRYPKIYRDHGENIKKYFSEFSKIKSIEQKDCQFFIIRVQKLIETLDKAQSKKRGVK